MHVYVCVWKGQGNLRPVFIWAGKGLQNRVFWRLLAISQFNGAVCCWAFNVLSFGYRGGKTYSEAGPCSNAVYLETLTSPCCIAAHVVPTLCHVKGYLVAQPLQSHFSWHIGICCMRKDTLCTRGFSCKQTDRQAKTKLLSHSKEKGKVTLPLCSAACCQSMKSAVTDLKKAYFVTERGFLVLWMD